MINKDAYAKPLEEAVKKIMAKVLNKAFVIKVFNDNLHKHYKDFQKVEKIELTPYKQHRGKTTAVFVVEYKVTYLTKDNKRRTVEIFVSAHSNGLRKEAFAKNQYLYNKGFNKGKFKVTKPLFYIEEQRGYFYVSSIGRRLFSFFTENPQADLGSSFKLVVGWLKKLHTFDYDQDKFTWTSFSIANMIPKPPRFIREFTEEDKEQGQLAEKLYKGTLKLEKEYSKKIKKALVYGDNHPENIIIENLETDHLEMIDFTDIALGDPMMDLGTFIQQFDFMGHNFISRNKMNEYKIFFIEAYFNKKFDKIDIEYVNRINLYQSWTALRSATFLFYMKDTEHPIIDLLHDSEKYLELAKNSQRKINLL